MGLPHFIPFNWTCRKFQANLGDASEALKKNPYAPEVPCHRVVKGTRRDVQFQNGATSVAAESFWRFPKEPDFEVSRAAEIKLQSVPVTKWCHED
eukprot:Skav228803  [mRNA]  locus=scaffold359:124300:125783:+ [translate_table: standard]